MKKGFQTLLDEANAEIKALSPQEAEKFLGRDDTVFVDLREAPELEREGTIPGALHAPRGLLEFWIDRDSPYHKPIFSSGKSFIFYCAGGKRSTLATKTAQDMGLGPVTHITGGIEGWRDAGLSTEPWKP